MLFIFTIYVKKHVYIVNSCMLVSNWECAHVARFLALSSIPVAEISG